ncbi:LLM class F420-dependent oxidoreductase [Rathayibacter soli]|uniref:LLM class F420-dependent oxidoreductase n=1 Tax=Rathayibacter soli TaxID=3144168 RepID=UPI0027E5381D|nr:LLM class F420-dependent oxidoreductase [Glaciibacter superstes]
MKFGLRLPGAGPYAGPEAISAFARKAEELGFDSLWMTDHIALPVDIESKYPYREDGKFFWPPETPYYDTILTLTWAAAATQRIRVGTSVLIASWHQPVNTAKALATLDNLNGGRTICAIGAGWMKEQFEILGAPFSERGARTTEYMRLLRHLWTEDVIDFQGDYFQYSGFKFYPKPISKPSIPLWCGGKSTGVLKRVAAVADGWHPLYIGPDELETKLTELSGYLAENGRSLADISLSARPVTQATLDRSTIERYHDLGVSLLIADTSFEHDTLQGVLDEVSRLADQLMPFAD